MSPKFLLLFRTQPVLPRRAIVLVVINSTENSSPLALPRTSRPRCPKRPSGQARYEIRKGMQKAKECPEKKLSVTYSTTFAPLERKSCLFHKELYPYTTHTNLGTYLSAQKHILGQSTTRSIGIYGSRVYTAGRIRVQFRNHRKAKPTAGIRLQVIYIPGRTQTPLSNHREAETTAGH